MKKDKSHIHIPELNSKIIPVTRPLLPPIKEFVPYLQEIWKNQWLTNNGPFHQQLEDELAKYLGVKYISLFANGTIALITALQALGIEGEVITTPYSFVATAHALKWNNLTPVFADIDETTFNLNPDKVESLITSRTSAILPVHCYGRPCDVKKLEIIGKRHNLKIIYDAAHSFGVSDKNGSILSYGHLSVLSFHATKVFNTFEGGAIVSPNPGMKRHIDHLKNFGFVNETTVVEVGINGKLNEIQSAFGLLQLKYLQSAIGRRRQIDRKYRNGLKTVHGIKVLDFPAHIESNYSYFPILVGCEYKYKRDELYEKLKNAGVFSRRYFYPLISDMSMYCNLTSASHENLPVATKLADQVLCLPIYPSLLDQEVDRVLAIIRK